MHIKLHDELLQELIDVLNVEYRQALERLQHTSTEAEYHIRERLNSIFDKFKLLHK